MAHKPAVMNAKLIYNGRRSEDPATPAINLPFINTFINSFSVCLSSCAHQYYLKCHHRFVPSLFQNSMKEHTTIRLRYAAVFLLFYFEKLRPMLPYPVLEKTAARLRGRPARLYSWLNDSCQAGV